MLLTNETTSDQEKPTFSLHHIYPFLPINFSLKSFINSSNFNNIRRCDDHKVLFCDFFCYDCCISICNSCKKGAHQGHKVLNKKIFLGKDASFDVFNDLLSTEFNYKARITEINNKKTGILKKIHEEIDDFQRRVNDIKTRIISQVNDYYSELELFYMKGEEKIEEAKLELENYLYENSDFYPDTYSDLMFLQGFNVFNSAYQLINIVKDLSSKASSYNNDFYINSERILSDSIKKIEKFHENSEDSYKKQDFENVTSSLTNQVLSYKKLLNENLIFNKKYLEQLDENEENDQINFIFSKKFALMSASSPGKSIFFNENPQNQSSSNLILSNTSNISQKDRRKSSEVIISDQQKKRRTMLFNNLRQSLLLPERKKYDLRLFNFAYIHYINKGELKWDGFISFGKTANQRLLDKKILNFSVFNKEESKVNPCFLMLVNDYMKKKFKSSKDSIIDPYIKDDETIEKHVFEMKCVSSTNQFLYLKRGKLKKTSLNLKSLSSNKTDTNQALYSLFPLGVSLIKVRSKIYFIGGIDLHKEYKCILSYSLKNHDLKFECNMLMPRSYSSLIHDGEFIYIIGGENNKSCEAFNILDKSSHLLPSLNSSRANGCLYLYRSQILYIFSGFKSEIYKNNHNDTIERLILRKKENENFKIKKEENFERSSWKWEGIAYKNRSKVDLMIECYGITPITDSLLMLYGGFSYKYSRRMILLYDIISEAVMELDSVSVEVIKDEVLSSKEFCDVIDKYVEDRVVI